MKTLVAVLLLLVLGITANAQKLDGKWKGKMAGPNGEMNLQYTFKVDGNKLSGNVASEFGELPLSNGKVNGKDFSFDLDVNGQVISSTGVVDGDVVKISAPMMEQPMVLNRVVEGAQAVEGAKIDGKWLGKASSPQGEFELTFTFKVDGNKLTGKSSSAMGDTELSNGVVNGNDFTFDIDMQGMKITHKCKYLADDSIDVKVAVMEQEIAMKLARAPK